MSCYYCAAIQSCKENRLSTRGEENNEPTTVLSAAIKQARSVHCFVSCCAGIALEISISRRQNGFTGPFRANSYKLAWFHRRLMMRADQKQSMNLHFLPIRETSPLQLFPLPLAAIPTPSRNKRLRRQQKVSSPNREREKSRWRSGRQENWINLSRWVSRKTSRFLSASANSRRKLCCGKPSEGLRS